MHPVDTAVWWTEHVIKNRDVISPYLRSFGAEQTWYVRRGLDVWFFLFMATLVLFGILAFIIAKVSKIVLCYSKAMPLAKDKKIR
jgi:hypothetical protein